jgi:N-acetylmuramic acid 6-phosphate etherase
VEYARELGATTIGITCSSGSPLSELTQIPIVIVVGPEVIAGSTRMKGGLAQKMALHALSTTVMVRLGRVRGNLMAELHGTNSKLRQRAVAIVSRLGHVTPEQARATLEASDGSVAAALERLRVPRRRLPRS